MIKLECVELYKKEYFRNCSGELVAMAITTCIFYPVGNIIWYSIAKSIKAFLEKKLVAYND